MRKIIGFVLFWIAVGMALTLIISNSVISVCILVLCLILGYNLFCN